MQSSQASEPVASWTVIVPYYNEREFLPATVESLCGQTLRPFELILVDNASSDGTRKVIEGVLQRLRPQSVRVRHAFAAKPGKIHALNEGLRLTETRFVALCDADTHYPADYLSRADALLRSHPEAAAALAIGISGPPRSPAARLARAKGALVGALLARQCHTGGFGQAFSTERLRQAGGFDADRWPYVLEDHEIMHRVAKLGRLRYGYAHYCAPSSRRGNRKSVDWTLTERLLYHLTPLAHRDWFFYRFLGPRLAARGAVNQALRSQPWRGAADQAGASKASAEIETD